MIVSDGGVGLLECAAIQSFDDSVLICCVCHQKTSLHLSPGVRFDRNSHSFLPFVVHVAPSSSLRQMIRVSEPRIKEVRL